MAGRDNDRIREGRKGRFPDRSSGPFPSRGSAVPASRFAFAGGLVGEGLVEFRVERRVEVGLGGSR